MGTFPLTLLHVVEVVALVPVEGIRGTATGIEISIVTEMPAMFREASGETMIVPTGLVAMRDHPLSIETGHMLVASAQHLRCVHAEIQKKS